MIYDVATHIWCTGTLLYVQAATHVALEEDGVEILTIIANARPASIIATVSPAIKVNWSCIL